MGKEKPRITDNTLREALHRHYGYITLVAGYFQCSTKNIHNHIKKHGLQDELLKARRDAADGYGSALMKAALDGDVRAAGIGWQSLKQYWEPGEERQSMNDKVDKVEGDYVGTESDTS